MWVDGRFGRLHNRQIIIISCLPLYIVNMILDMYIIWKLHVSLFQKNKALFGCSQCFCNKLHVHTYTVYISQYIFCNKLHVHTYTVYISQYITMKILATGRWFSSGTPVSSTNKTDCHDIIEILLKVALSTLTLITLQ